MREGHKFMRSRKSWGIALIAAGILLCMAGQGSAQQSALKPDLVVDKIALNPAGNIVVEIRNAGPGPLPDKAWVSTESYAACFVIMIGVQFVDYATLWAADPNRVLRNPGGTITYTSPIKIQEPTAIRVWIDPTEQIEEASKANNMKTVLVKPEAAK
ncbi:MAG TPA: hypothetical protein VMB77_02960 [Syntrophales bacterium]|nr:hypothetical protein [Syntrophales bacterium]